MDGATPFPLIASIAATCIGGFQLEPIAVPLQSGQYAVTYDAPTSIGNDTGLQQYQYFRQQSQQDLTAANPYGFRAVSLAYVLPALRA